MGNLENFIKERKQLAVNQFCALPLEQRESKVTIDGREVSGYAIVWGSKNSYNEIVLKGATLNSLNARGVGSGKNEIQFLKFHNPDDIVGKLTELREDDYGLFFKVEILKTQLGEDTLEQIRAGVLKQLSYGFNYIWDKTEYDEASDAYVLREIKLWEISLVTWSADENAQLRSFGEFQKQLILKDLNLRELNAIINLANAEIQSRDKHFEDLDENAENIITLF